MHKLTVKEQPLALCIIDHGSDARCDMAVIFENLEARYSCASGSLTRSVALQHLPSPPYTSRHRTRQSQC